MKIESREGRKKLSIVPMGLNKEKPIIPSVKTLGYFQFGREYYEMASPLLPCRSGIDSSPLILSSIEEERKKIRQRGRAVFCLSVCASVLNWWQIDAKHLRGRGGVRAGIDGGRLQLAFRKKSCQWTCRGGCPQFLGQADLTGFAPGFNRFFESLGHPDWV